MPIFMFSQTVHPNKKMYIQAETEDGARSLAMTKEAHNFQTTNRDSIEPWSDSIACCTVEIVPNVPEEFTLIS